MWVSSGGRGSQTGWWRDCGIGWRSEDQGSVRSCGIFQGAKYVYRRPRVELGLGMWLAF